MTARHPAIEPRLLSRELAAAYCGLSIPTFESQCPVAPIKIRTRVLYDRVMIDRWLDSLGPQAAESPAGTDWASRLDDDARQGH